MAAVKFRRLGHPSLKKLHRWANGEAISIDRHLATCDYCADRLEPLIDDSNESIRLALLRLLAVPDQLPDRLRVSINKRLSDQRDLQLIGEFFGLPFRMARIMTSNEQEDD